MENTFKKIAYQRTVNFTGRNGYFKQTGIEVELLGPGHKKDEWITIKPVTSKGDTGHCLIEIPLENVAAVINALMEITGVE